MLERLHSRLSADATVVVQALHGMGGVGKTQLAIEYAFRFASEYELVWWFDAEQPVVVYDQFSRLAERLGLSAGLPGPDAVSAVLETLSARERWLLIFDNVSEPPMLAPFRPSTLSGRVLVTSRHPGWGAYGGHLDTDVFARAESVEMLERRLPGTPAGVIDDLAAELGDLPLGLEQAAGYLDATATPPARYLARFRARREQLLSAGSVPDHVLLDATWALSLERIAEVAPPAVELLELSAFLAPHPLAPRLFRADPAALPPALAAAVADEFGLDDVLGVLTAYALIRRTDSNYEVHRLVQAAVRRMLTPQRRRERTGAVLALLQESLPM